VKAEIRLYNLRVLILKLLRVRLIKPHSEEDLFEKEMNKSSAPSYLTIPLISEIKGLLNKAMDAYSTGIDRAAYAYLSKNVQESNALRGSALTGFA